MQQRHCRIEIGVVLREQGKMVERDVVVRLEPLRCNENKRSLIGCTHGRETGREQVRQRIASCRVVARQHVHHGLLDDLVSELGKQTGIEPYIPNGGEA